MLGVRSALDEPGGLQPDENLFIVWGVTKGRLASSAFETLGLFGPRARGSVLRCRHAQRLERLAHPQPQAVLCALFNS